MIRVLKTGSFVDYIAKPFDQVLKTGSFMDYIAKPFDQVLKTGSFMDYIAISLIYRYPTHFPISIKRGYKEAFMRPRVTGRPSYGARALH